MTLTTSYRLLGAPNLSSTIFASLQNYTGAYLAYGLDTPIDLLNVLINCDVRTTLYCLNYCTVDTTNLQLQIGLAMAGSWSEIIETYEPIEDRYQRLLYFANLYLQAQGQAPAPPRYDYAGHIIPGVSSITANQVDEYITLMQSVVDSYTTTKANPGYQIIAGTTNNESTLTYASGQYGVSVNGTPAQNASGDFVYSPVVDQNNNPVTLFQDIYFNDINPTIDGYVPELITTALIDGSYGVQSDEMNTTIGPSFALIQLTPSGALYVTDPATYPPVLDNGALAVKYMGLAAIAAAIAVKNGLGACSVIYNYVHNAVQNYGYDQRLQLQAQLYTLVQLATGTIPPAPSADITGQTLVEAVIQAGDTYRNAKLTDLAFWQSFDTNLSLKLEMNERYNAEVALRAGVVNARKAAALTYVLTANERYGACVSLTDGMSVLLGTYLS